MNAREPIVLTKLDRHFWLAILLAAVVLIIRAILIASAHNECLDTQDHLRQGLAFLTGNPAKLTFMPNDPPLGKALLALPMLITGCLPEKPICEYSWPHGVPRPDDAARDETDARFQRTIRRAVLYGNHLRPETILLLIAIFKSLLFLPCAAVIFQWSRAVYGLASAWLAAALLLVDPTFAAHVPIAALDSFGLAAIVVACFCIWRFFEKPAIGRLALASLAIAAAMLIKHTAAILPLVTVLYAAIYWDWQRAPRRGVNMLLLGVIFTLLFMWILLGFDYSAPADQGFPQLANLRAGGMKSFLAALAQRKWPLGTYIGCLASGFITTSFRHWSLLRGQIRAGGWWYYFPVLATYKIPIGIFCVIALGLISHLKFRWRRGELSILIPLFTFTGMLLTTHVNYSFRHFLPAYVFILLWATRCGIAAKWMRMFAWLAVLAAFVDTLRFNPDYLSYVNFPREKIWMQITDSNLDWGQGIRQVRPWLDAHPQHRTVYLAPRNDPRLAPAYYLDDRVHVVARGQTPPRRGLLIISPVWICGVYDEGENPYGFLQAIRPIDVIGHSMLVYDLDRDLK